MLRNCSLMDDSCNYRVLSYFELGVYIIILSVVESLRTYVYDWGPTLYLLACKISKPIIDDFEFIKKCCFILLPLSSPYLDSLSFVDNFDAQNLNQDFRRNGAKCVISIDRSVKTHYHSSQFFFQIWLTNKYLIWKE